MDDGFGGGGGGGYPHICAMQSGGSIKWRKWPLGLDFDWNDLFGAWDTIRRDCGGVSLVVPVIHLHV